MTACKLTLGDEIIENIRYENTTSITELVLTNATRIGYCAFENCKNLETIYLPDTLKEIGDNAFAGCENLKEVIFNKKLEKIGRHAFAETGLEKVVFNGRTVILENAFQYCNKLKNIELKNIQSTNSVFEFSGLENVVIDSSRVNRRMFYNCEQLKYVTMKNCKVIESQAFLWCTGLEEIVIPEGVEKIETGSFSNCTELRKVFLPHSLKEIGINTINSPGLEIVYNGYNEDFQKIKGIDNLTRYNIVKKINFNKTLSELLEEGYTFKESHDIVKGNIER